jgi:hypothetical protein
MLVQTVVATYIAMPNGGKSTVVKLNYNTNKADSENHSSNNKIKFN